ncbi:hypothetical protein GCK32_015019 [Trichostrongylus colubriformis]|uniref:Uncharacterized protein n=1 Tax=Trichostrongylus colubriformis TaxID=6319 RepID=A0AAN8G1J5_TRICO
MSPEVDGDVTDENSRDDEIEQLKEKVEYQQREIEALRLQVKRAETLGQRIAATEGKTIPEWTRKAAQGENLSVEELQDIHWSESSESTHRKCVVYITSPFRPALMPDESTALIKYNNSDYDSMKNDDIQFHCHDEQSKDDNIKSAKAKRILWISLGICFFFMICEVVGGVWAKSLAIVTDAAHLRAPNPTAAKPTPANISPLLITFFDLPRRNYKIRLKTQLLKP